MTKKILYIDMDNVLVDFESGIRQLDAATLKQYEGHLDDVPGIFSKMVPMTGAVEAFHLLADNFDTYILSTSPWDNPTAGSEKLAWVKKYLGEKARKRLILSHHKHLNIGDFLVDDRDLKHGIFIGEFIKFGVEPFLNWPFVVNYLMERK
jgi:5'(3')-deoxyribonucleotidase